MRQITIDGRLGKDALVETSPNGKNYIRFSIANTVFKDKQEKTEWFDITSFDPFIVNNGSKALTKGSYVIVTGTWETETNVSPTTNKLYVNHRVIASNVEVPNLGKKNDGTAPTVATPAVETPQVPTPTINIPSVEARLNQEPAPTVTTYDGGDDDLPF